jgi:hypothetical protein
MSFAMAARGSSSGGTSSAATSGPKDPASSGRAWSRRLSGIVSGAQPQEPDGRGSGVPELVEGQRPGGGDLLAVPGDLQGLPPR